MSVFSDYGGYSDPDTETGRSSATFGTLEAGAHDALQMLSTFGYIVGKRTSSPILQERSRLSYEAEKGYGEEAISELPTFRQNQLADPIGLDNFSLATLGAQFLRNTPSMVAGLGTAAGATALAGPAAGVATGAAMAGALGTGDAMSSIMDDMASLTPEEVQQLPYFKQWLDQGMDPEQAKQAGIQYAIGNQDIVQMALQTGLGLIAPEVWIGRMVGGGAGFGRGLGRVKSASIAAPITAMGGAAEEGSAAMTQNVMSETTGGLIPETSVEQAALAGAILEGPGGVVAGFAGGGKPYTKVEPGELDEAETAALTGEEVQPPGQQLALPPPGGPIQQPGSTTAPLALPPPPPRDVRGGRVITPDVINQPGATFPTPQLEAPGTVPSASRAPGVIPLGDEAIPDAAPGADPLVQSLGARRDLVAAGFQPAEIDAWDHEEAVEALVAVAREKFEQSGNYTPQEIEDMTADIRQQVEAGVSIEAPTVTPSADAVAKPTPITDEEDTSNSEVITAPVADEAIPTEQPTNVVPPLPVAPTATAKPAPAANPVVIPGVNTQYTIRPLPSGFALFSTRKDGLEVVEGRFRTQDEALDWIEQKEAQAAPAPVEEAIPTVEATPEPQGASQTRPTRVSAPPLAAETEVAKPTPIADPEVAEEVRTPSEIFSPEETAVPQLTPEQQARYDRIQAAAAEQEAAEQETVEEPAAVEAAEPLTEVAPSRLRIVPTTPIGERDGARILEAAPTRADQKLAAQAYTPEATETERRKALNEQYPQYAHRTDLNTAQIEKLATEDPKKAADLIEANPAESDATDAIGTVMRLENILAQAQADNIAFPGDANNLKGRVSKNTADHIMWLADMARTVRALSKNLNDTEALLRYQANEAAANANDFTLMRGSFGGTSAGRSGGVGTGGVDIEQIGGGIQAANEVEAAEIEQAQQEEAAPEEDTDATTKLEARPFSGAVARSEDTEAAPSVRKSASKPIVTERKVEAAPVRKVEVTPEAAARALAAMQAAEAKNAPPKTGPKTPTKPAQATTEKSPQSDNAPKRGPKTPPKPKSKDTFTVGEKEYTTTRELVADIRRTRDENDKRVFLLGDMEALENYAKGRTDTVQEMQDLLQQNLQNNIPRLHAMEEYTKTAEFSQRKEAEKAGGAKVKFKDITDASERGPSRNMQSAMAAAQRQAAQNTNLANTEGALNFNGNWVRPVHRLTVNEAVEGLGLDNPRNWLGAHNRLVRGILQLIQKTHPDLDVYVLRAGDIETARGNSPSDATNVDGFYARMHPDNLLGKPHIVVREDEWNKSDVGARLLAHEGIHPLTVYMLDQFPAMAKALQSLSREIQALHGVFPQGAPFASKDKSYYGLVNERETLAEITDPRFAELLHNTPISRKLANQLGLEGWRKATAWNGIVAAIRKWFNELAEKMGFAPVADFTAFDAVLSIIERGSHQFDAEGLAAYQARGLEAGNYTDPNYLSAEGDFGKARRSAAKHIEWMQLFYDLPTAAQAAPIDAKLQDQFTLATARAVARSSGNTLKGRLRNATLYVRSMDSIMRGYEHMFQSGTLRRYVNAILRRFTLSKELNALDANLMREKAALLDKYAGKTINGVSAQEVYENSLHDQSNWNVDASIPLAQNKWLHDKNGKIPLRNRAATSKHAALEKQYNSLPADMKTFMKKEFQFYKDKQARIMDGILTNTVMAASGGKLGKAAALALGKRVADGTATQSDIDTIGKNAASRISKADFKVQHGPYVPQLRFGDYVVNAVVKIADPVVGKWNRVNSPQSYIVDFHGPRGEADAMRFANNREEYAEIKRVWTINGKATDPQGNPFSQKDVINGAVESYRVTIQNRHVEFFASEGEAKAAAEELKGDKYYESVSPANVRENTGESFGQEGASARALQAIVDELQKTDDALGNLPSHVKANMRQAMQQAVYRAAPGTSISKRRLKRKHIAGASKDSLRVMHSYSTQANNYIAGIETAHEMSEAYKPLKIDADRNYAGVEITPQAVLNELSSRRNSQAAEQSSPLVNTLTTVQFVDKLASPAYSIINMMQMPMVTLPELAKSHGLFNSSRALSRAMGKIGLGQITKAGAGDTQKAFMARLEKATSYHDLITKNNPGVSKREAAMLDKLVEYGSLDPDSGFEASKGTAGGKLLHWLEESWRQAPRAIEAMNRYGTALAAYELSMKKHGDHAKAVEYARDMVDSTQFNYSAANSSPIFNKPLGRVAFQFMKFGTNMYQLMGANTVNLFSKHSTKAERIAAAKGLTYLIGAHVIMSGFGGLPLEPIRGLVSLLQAGGVDIDWERDVEFAVREVMAEAVGSTMAEILSKGLPRYVFNVDVSQRMGLSDLLVARPQMDLDERGGLASYLVQMVGGATVGSGLDLFNGAQDIADGNVMKGVGKVIPLKMFSDFETMIRQGTTGKVSEAGDPVLTYSPLDMLVRGLGFRPATEANVSERRAATADRTQAIRDEDTAIKQRAHAGGYTPSQLAAAIRAANAGRPTSQWITADEVRQFSSNKTKDYKKNIGSVIPHGNVDIINEIMQTIPD